MPSFRTLVVVAVAYAHFAAAKEASSKREEAALADGNLMERIMRMKVVSHGNKAVVGKRQLDTALGQLDSSIDLTTLDPSAIADPAAPVDLTADDGDDSSDGSSSASGEVPAADDSESDSDGSSDSADDDGSDGDASTDDGDDADADAQPAVAKKRAIGAVIVPQSNNATVSFVTGESSAGNATLPLVMTVQKDKNKKQKTKKPKVTGTKVFQPVQKKPIGVAVPPVAMLPETTPEAVQQTQPLVAAPIVVESSTEEVATLATQPVQIVQVTTASTPDATYPSVSGVTFVGYGFDRPTPTFVPHAKMAKVRRAHRGLAELS